MTTILPRRGTAAEWTTADPVLAMGELGYETDTKKWKRGDGATAWTALAYYQPAWADITSKPAVIAAGADQAAARAAIGALDTIGVENIVGNYEPESISLFDRITVRPDADRRYAINALIAALKEYGLWDRLDGLYMFAAHTQQAALLNWRRTSANMSAVNSPTFTTDVGFTGDMVSSSLVVPSAETVNTTALDSMISLWVYSVNTISTVFDFWWTNWGYAFGVNRSATQTSWRAATQTTRVVTSPHVGLFTATRHLSNEANYYLDGSVIDTSTNAYDNTLSYWSISPIRILSQNGTSSFSDSTVSFAAYGGAMDEIETALFYNAVNDYMIAVGVV